MAHMANVSQANLLRKCRYWLKISYIGTKYRGLQRQINRDSCDDNQEDGTIQTALEKSLNRALYPVYGARLSLSSRTDAGVHAYMNTATVDLTHPLPNTIYKPSFITNNTNQILSFHNHEITIIETRLIPYYFNPRVNAKWRSYVYRIAVVNDENYSKYPQQVQYQLLRSFLPLCQINRCHIVCTIDIELVKKSCEILQGQHDFILFMTKCAKSLNNSTDKYIDEFQFNKCQSLNGLEIGNKLHPKIEFYEFFIKSKSFLYNQVRKMVSAVIDVGLGRITLQELENMIQTPFIRPTTLSQMAPACGLYLFEIHYDEKDFILYDNFQDYSSTDCGNLATFDEDDDEE